MVKAQWFMWMSVNGHDFMFPQGAYRQDMVENYLRTGLGSLTHGVSPQVIQEVRHHEPWSQWWYNITGCRDAARPTLPQCHYQQVRWPVIMSAGWWDIFQMTQLDAWRGFRADSHVSVRDRHVLFVGPNGHCEVGSPVHPILFAGEAAGLVVAVQLASELFAGDTSANVRSKIGRVNLYIMGAFEGPTGGNYWTSLEEFPRFTATSFYLQTQGRLTLAPSARTSFTNYSYDPRNPTPMLGGTNLPGIGNISVCGTADQTSRHIRSDVRVFDTKPLTADLLVVGSISSRLFVSSSAKDTDFFVTIEDVLPSTRLKKEKSFLLRYGMARMRWLNSDTKPAEPLTPDRTYEVEIDCGNTAFIFQKGHSVRVTVSSAAAPYFNPNSNTGTFDLVEPVTPITADNTVHFGGDTASRVVFPVVSMSDIPKNSYFDKPIQATQLGMRAHIVSSAPMLEFV